MFLLSVSLVALLHLGVAGAEPVHFPLMRKSTVLTAENYAAAADHMRYKYGYSSDSAISKRQALTSQSAGTAYTGVAGVGGGGTALNVVLDTGSSDFFVPGTGCSTCTADTPTFNYTDSSTFKFINDLATDQPKDVSINYGGGTVEGSLAQDTLSMGSFKVKHQPFLLADKVPPGILFGTSAGIMGLGFSALAATQSTPFWQTLATTGALPEPEMSFFLARPPKNADPSKESFGGFFTLGGQNKTLFEGDVEFLPLVTIGGSLTHWALDLVSVTVNGKCIDLPPRDVAIIDTGTTLIGGPCAPVAAIYEQIPGSKKLTGDHAGQYGFPCDATVEISVSFGGEKWAISPEDINLGPLPDCPGLCLGAIFELNLGPTGSNTWIFGDTFLKNAYTVFRADPPSLGLAKLADCAK